jgi:membrane protein required for colicin V production
MSYIDIILAVPLLWALYKGFRKGLIIEVASLLALVVGIYGSIHFSSYIAEFLKNNFGSKSAYLHIFSFAITFILIVLAIYILAHLLEKVVETVSLSLVNKILGAIFGLIKAAIILSVLLYFINTLDANKNFISQSRRDESRLYNPISYLSIKVMPAIKKIVVNNKDRILKTEPKNPLRKL